MSQSTSSHEVERQLRSFLSTLHDSEVEQLLLEWQYDWSKHARPEQIPPTDKYWTTFLYLAGRGAGKTRSGAEWVRSQIESGRSRNVALVAPTARDARKIIVEGESGLLAICPPWARPMYEPSKLMLTWPNGGRAHMYSAEEPERLRGPNHDAAWCDELASWFYIDETWSNLEFTLRAGTRPKRYITTTPRPRRLIKEIANDPTTVMVRGSTFDNKDNLAPDFLRRVVEKYDGTRLGRQELYAEILEDVPGALWTQDMVDACRVRQTPHMQRIVVSVDPAAVGEEGNSEHGIVVNGKGHDDRYYLLADVSCHGSPDTWARRAIRAFDHWQADKLVAETNQGGEMVRHVLEATAADMARKGERTSAEIMFTKVMATRGKQVRAEPISLLYEQNRVSHVGVFRELENQMCLFVPGVYDGLLDRLDAHVWGMTELTAPSFASYAGSVAL